jgi:hypothetical protein
VNLWGTVVLRITNIRARNASRMLVGSRPIHDSSAGIGRPTWPNRLFAGCGFSVGSLDGIETHPIDPSRTEDIIQANVVDKSLWLLSNSVLLLTPRSISLGHHHTPPHLPGPNRTILILRQA